MPIRTTLLATALENTPLQALSVGTRQSFVFNAYGHRLASSGPPSLGYNGERFEALTGHYLLGKGYRAYNPMLMRFNGPDHFSPFGGGGINAYAYGGGDPVNLLDPSGHIAMRFRGRPQLLNGPQRVARTVPAITTNHFYGRGRSYPDATNTQTLEDAFIFMDQAGKRTNVDAHGSPGYVMFNGKQRSGAELVAELRAIGAINAKTEQIRLVTCKSADLGPQSLAASVARASGLPTKGYHGWVFTQDPEVVQLYNFRRSGPMLDNMVQDRYQIFKEIRSTSPHLPDVPRLWHDTWRHRSETFRPRM